MLQQLTKRIWFLPGEEETDRPNLFYIHGDRKSLAVDAGNSGAHVEKFYRALREKGLPVPDYTALTHWHWDHSFGLAAVGGSTLASDLTNEKLRQVRSWRWSPELMAERERTGEDIAFCNTCIMREYPDLEKIQVIPAEVELSGRLMIDLGNVTCRLECRDSPHSRDSLFLFVPEEQALFVGDADCEDYYENGGKYDPARLRDLLDSLKQIDYRHHLRGHDQPRFREEALKELRELLQEAETREQ